MSDTKISALPAATAALGTDETVVNEGGTSKKLTLAQIKTFVFSAPSVQEIFLTSPVTLTAANTYYPVLSLTLAPGTYLLMGSLQIFAPIGVPAWASVKLWDGVSTVLDAPSSYISTGGSSDSLAVRGVATVTTTTTYILAAATDHTGAEVDPTAPYNGVTNRASHLIAVRIGG